MNKPNPKYKKMLTPQQLGFLQYYMLPQSDQFDYIYRPGDDSFLMLSVLKNQINKLQKNPIVCEVGSGSGILSVHFNKWLKQINKQPILHIATDISFDACSFSCRYYEHYGLNIQQVCTSLFKGLRFQPQIIICNPPYVPTDVWQKQSELKYLKQKIQSIRQRNDIKRSPNKNLIAYTYMGGPEGLDTTRLLINSITWQTKLYIIVMGEQGLQTLDSQVNGGKILNKKIKSASFQLLQFMKKMNQELYVVLICTKIN